jgi:serine protease
MGRGQRSELGTRSIGLVPSSLTTVWKLAFGDDFSEKMFPMKKLTPMSFFFAFSAIVVLSPVAVANTIHVPADQPTIQMAINAATNGDMILVSPGTYFEHIDYDGKAITIQSTNGAAQTTIDGSNSGTVVTFQNQEGLQSVLTGFTIRHGSESFGAGIMLQGASPTITKNIFFQNHQGDGGFGAAIGGNVASPVIEGNSFSANTCDTQFLSGVVSFVNGSAPKIINNIFLQNPCRAVAMILPQEGNPVVANNTMVQNSVGVYVAAGVPAPGVYLNNILMGNDVGLFIEDGSPGTYPVWENNLVFGSVMANYSGIPDQTGIDGNISADPQFLSTSTFELRRSSPAIDAGILSVPSLPPTDFAGNPRVLNGNGDNLALPDIGALEFVLQKRQ